MKATGSQFSLSVVAEVMIHKITSKSTIWGSWSWAMPICTYARIQNELCALMQSVHTCACAFDIIIKNCFILSSSRHTQKAGLRRRRVPHNKETLEGDTLTHFSMWSVTEACWAERRFLSTVPTGNYTAGLHDNEVARRETLKCKHKKEKSKCWQFKTREEKQQ